uniref:phage tail fiber protein n=2 Tax=Enterobacter TaxID=547 RepID=UPI001F00FBC3
YSRHIDNFSNTNMLGFGRFTSQTVNNPENTHGVGVQLQYDGGPSTSWFVWTIDGQAYIQTGHVQGTTYLWKKVYTTANTTVASDGSIKAASPVARIVTSRDVCQRADIAEDGFSWCGCGTANAEAEGIIISRLDVGVYMLTGSAGLASSGWQLLPPMDPGGMGELGVVEAEQTESGGLTVRLFKRKYMLNDEGEIVKTKGAPMDVPSNSWIDVRLDMPENSVWNQRQKAAMEAADNESGS